MFDKLNLSSVVYDTDEIKKLPNDKNPLDPINEIHSLTKRFMKTHDGYNWDDLQDFMNLISFILNDPKELYEKVDLFINMALNELVMVQYRNVMSKKEA